ncbi:Uridine kinase [Thalictrum thalictroides]|uniref:Uridine kinase n=1 Tax=Thalictrum thalictroides TaxID=46969 RepID=A0A7J6VUD9_THATH|nr:Uridine kinase [Thalictrum thalictroides]
MQYSEEVFLYYLPQANVEDAFDTEQLLECVGQLKCGQSVHVPIYDFKNHQRCSESFHQVNASDVIILEGILVFHDQCVRNLMNMKIFVDTVKVWPEDRDV